MQKEVPSKQLRMGNSLHPSLRESNQYLVLDRLINNLEKSQKYLFTEFLMLTISPVQWMLNHDEKGRFAIL